MAAPGGPQKRSQKQATLPTDLALEIEAILEANPWLGYASLSAFTTEGARRLLRETMQDIYQHRAVMEGHMVPPGRMKKKSSDSSSPPA